MPMRRPLSFAVVLAACACSCGPSSEPPDASLDAPPARPAVSERRSAPVRPLEARPSRPQTDDFDARPVEFDTIEPPPVAPPAPPPDEPPPPTASGVSGSCDVRATENFCFAYTGPGWTPSQARAHCGRAPAARFDGGVCPAADRIATCAFERPDAAGQTLVYTYYAPYPVELARLACPGTFEEVQ